MRGVRTIAVLPALACVAGIVVVLTLHSLLGPILIVAGAGSLFVLAIPAATQRVARWLSVGSFGRRDD